MRILLLALMMTAQLFCKQAFAADVAIGRLFFTPEQRSDLDRLRAKDQALSMKAGDIEDNMAQHSLKQLPRKKTVQGYVKRNDGKQRTIWVDGKAIQEDQP